MNLGGEVIFHFICKMMQLLLIIFTSGSCFICDCVVCVWGKELYHWLDMKIITNVLNDNAWSCTKVSGLVRWRIWKEKVFWESANVDWNIYVLTKFCTKMKMIARNECSCRQNKKYNCQLVCLWNVNMRMCTCIQFRLLRRGGTECPVQIQSNVKFWGQNANGQEMMDQVPCMQR